MTFDLDAITPQFLPGDLVANKRGSRIGKLCDLLGLSRAETIGTLVLLYHYTAHHVGIHIRNTDDGWAYEPRSLCLIPDYADWHGTLDWLLWSLEQAGYGRKVGDEFVLFAPVPVV